MKREGRKGKGAKYVEFKCLLSASISLAFRSLAGSKYSDRIRTKKNTRTWRNVPWKRIFLFSFHILWLPNQKEMAPDQWKMAYFFHLESIRLPAIKINQIAIQLASPEICTTLRWAKVSSSIALMEILAITSDKIWIWNECPRKMAVAAQWPRTHDTQYPFFFHHWRRFMRYGFCVLSALYGRFRTQTIDDAPFILAALA